MVEEELSLSKKGWIETEVNNWNKWIWFWKHLIYGVCFFDEL